MDIDIIVSKVFACIKGATLAEETKVPISLQIQEKKLQHFEFKIAGLAWLCFDIC